MGITTIAVKKLKPKTRIYEHMDKTRPGFGVRVHTTGAKSFIYRYRINGRLRRITLGACDDIDLKEAHSRYRDNSDSRAQGVDPLDKKFEAKIKKQQDLSFRLLAKIYLEKHAIKKRTSKEDERILNHDVLPKWQHRKAKAIHKRDVIALIDNVVERGAPIQANRTLSCVRKIFNFAVEKDLLEVSPCTAVKAPAAERTQDRVLSNDEIRLLWTLSLSPKMLAALKLQLLLAQRIGEIVGMRWSEIDLPGKVWTLPAARTKNKALHVIPLVDTAIEILNDLSIFQTDSDFVFWSQKREHIRVDSIGTALRRILNEVNASHFSSHCLRRTAATRLSGLKISREVLRQILNHKDQTVTGRYDWHRYDLEKRSALGDWERELLRIVDLRNTENNVVNINQIGR